MTFEQLATGATVKALGLVSKDGFWLAVVLLLLAIAIELFVFKSIRDRRVLGEETVVNATIVLAMVSMLCFVGGLMILFF